MCKVCSLIDYIYIFLAAKTTTGSQEACAKHLQTLQKEFAALAKLPKSAHLSESLALHFVGTTTRPQNKKGDKPVALTMPTKVYHVQSHWQRAANVGAMPLADIVQLATCTLRALHTLHSKDVLHKSVHVDCIYRITDDASRQQFAIADYVVRCAVEAARLTHVSLFQKPND